MTAPENTPPQCGEKSLNPTAAASKPPKRPWGLEWRSSVWFVTLVVGLATTTDLLVYSMIVPIIPFRLQSLGYEGISGLVGWLLFAYSAALVIFTPPIAFLSEMYKNRKVPLLLGQVALIGSQVLLMEAPAFWVMVLARIAQGISACVIWVVGLALLCDTVPEKNVGKQLGFAMMGMSLGFLVGPPVAGALDERFGFRGPFIFGIIVTAIEFIGRLLIIERKEAIRLDASFTSLVGRNASHGPAYGTLDAEKREAQQTTDATPRPTAEESHSGITEAPTRALTRTASATVQQQETQQDPVQLSIVGLLMKLLKSSRALSAVFLALSYGVMITALEPVLPLYLQSTFGLDVSKIGLVYIAAIVPSFISSPLSGWYSDRGGTVASIMVCLIGALPFYILIFIRVNLVYFLAMFTLLNLFATGSFSPITAEFAAVTRSMEGVGYAHVYGAFNIAYGIGSAIGPVIGGQLYDHSGNNGWMALCLFNAAFLVVSLAVTVCYFGEPTIVQWAKRRFFRHANPGTGANELAAAQV